eukprot:7148156-Pyramimonas_sp.AAC.1
MTGSAYLLLGMLRLHPSFDMTTDSPVCSTACAYTSLIGITRLAIVSGWAEGRREASVTKSRLQCSGLSM